MLAIIEYYNGNKQIKEFGEFYFKIDEDLAIDSDKFCASTIKYIKLYNNEYLIAHFVSYPSSDNIFKFEEIKFGFKNVLSQTVF